MYICTTYTLHGKTKTHTLPLCAWAVNMAPKENCKVNCRPPDAVRTVGTQVFFRWNRWKGWFSRENVSPKLWDFFVFDTSRKMNELFGPKKRDLPSKGKETIVFQSHHFGRGKLAVPFPGGVFIARTLGFSHHVVGGKRFFSQSFEGIQWKKLGRHKNFQQTCGWKVLNL